MNRQQQITHWLSTLFPDATFELAPASADASFRRYFRVTLLNRTMIVMDAPPQHEDCRPFIHVAQLFAASGVHVPQILAQDLEHGFLLLSDLGATTYFQSMLANHQASHQTNHARQLYGAATDALIAIQLASRENELPPYDETLLMREMRLFPEWYIAKHRALTLNEKQSATLENIFQRIVHNNLAQPRVYVHRDYHSRNLMYIEHPLLNPLEQTTSHSTRLLETAAKSLVIPHAGEEANDKGNLLISPGILDFQDAVYGPITYDLASLFKDAYLRWEEAEVLGWLITYWEKARKVGLPVHADFADFYRDYEWMGVQRHLKVLGIFARLSHRDGKDGYLKDLPLVMDYLRRACERYLDLKPLLRLLDTLEAHTPAHDRANVNGINP